MATKAVMDIVDYATHFIHLYTTSGLNYTEADLATDIVAMLPNETITETDIVNACQYVSDAYSGVDKAILTTEISNNLAEKKSKSRTKSAIFILGGLFLGYVIFRKR
jgi:hypothetical protein